MKTTTASYQVIACKISSIQKIPQLWQMALKKGRKACQLFFSSFDMCGPIYETVTCSKGLSGQPLEDKATQVGLWPVPTTTLIINISNSTLIDCAIGNDSYPSAVVENQPLMQAPKLQMHEQLRCSCGQQRAAHSNEPDPPPLSEEPQSISIHSSQLNCVIIGHNNSMHVHQTQQSEEEPYL